MQRIFEIWVFKMRPWMRWGAKVIISIICILLLAMIAAGVVSVWVRTVMHDY